MEFTKNMNSAELQKSNANYNAAALLERVRELIDRDNKLLSGVLVRSALKIPPGAAAQHIMTRIDVLPHNQTLDAPELLNYGATVFVRESLPKGALLSRLGALSEKKFQIGEYTLALPVLGFNDDYEPSRNSYSDWPCRVFNVSFGSVQLPYEQLLHPKLKSFPSIHDAIQEFFNLETFAGQSDGRLGQLRLVIPNLNARIESLALPDRQLHIKTTGAAPPSSLKLAITYKHEKRTETLNARSEDREIICKLTFSPTELSIWLLSEEGFLADFHDETQYYSRGANSILPKKNAGQEAQLSNTVPQFVTTLKTIEMDTPRRRAKSAATATDPPTSQKILVLISHSSKDRSLAESLIELLRAGLGLRADQIRCTSVDGYRLPAGVNTDDQLRKEIKSVGVLIGLLTHNSLSSTYVLFELGARWGAELPMIPLLAGITSDEMRGPHRVLNALSCETEGQIFQLVTDVAAALNIKPQSPESYLKHVHALKHLADSITTANDRDKQAEREHVASPNPHAETNPGPSSAAPKSATTEGARRIDAMRLWIRLERGKADNFLIFVESKSDEHMVIEEVGLESDGYALKEPEFPPTPGVWNIAPHGTLPIGFYCRTDPAATLIRMHDSEGLLFKTDLRVLLKVRILGELYDFAQRIPVKVNASTLEIVSLQ